MAFPRDARHGFLDCRALEKKDVLVTKQDNIAIEKKVENGGCGLKKAILDFDSD